MRGVDGLGRVRNGLETLARWKHSEMNDCGELEGQRSGTLEQSWGRQGPAHKRTLRWLQGSKEKPLEVRRQRTSVRQVVLVVLEIVVRLGWRESQCVKC